MSIHNDSIVDDASGPIEVKDRDKNVMRDKPSTEHDSDTHDEVNLQMYQTIQMLTTYLSNIQEDGEELAAGFQRIPNRRALPDYFDVISDPIAFSTIRGKIQKKQYSKFSDFVRDVAQICHNAQVYNRPSAPIFGAAVRLQSVFDSELKKLAANGVISANEAKLPDLGDLPPVDDSPSQRSQNEASQDEEVDEDDEQELEEEEGEEDDDDEDASTDGGIRRQKQKRKRTREHQEYISRRGRDDEKEEDAHKKRGRPPMVQTPMEARISSIIRGLRKIRNNDGMLMIRPFEKLPDKLVMAGYYQIIHNPIALDNIKKKAKRKKYRDVDELQKDIDLMFDNAKTYNEDDSAVYIAAAELQKQSRVLSEQEKAKPDNDFRDEDGRLPLIEVRHNGETWRVGDWVHIRNPNDLAKPIVAQIFRIWQDRAEQKWINACWYYRPEQTVHRYEKHFFEHEVLKTGQYRDHQISELLDRCFVMFVTRFSRGRPRGFPSDKAVYVCESRYNEEKFRFNKIKTWASCVPDEVRGKDYEMDLFDAPRQVRKVPSPIKHLLREDAKSTDALPRPTWGSPNAPPIVGAVHRRPAEPNETPPPEPAPPPTSLQTVMDISSEATLRHSGSSLAPDLSMDTNAKSHQSGIHGASSGPSPISGQYNIPAASHFQPATPGSIGQPLQQTPVPIPQPPQSLSTPQSGLRPMHFPPQQPAYTSNLSSTYSQANTAFVHNQVLTNQGPIQYNQQLGRTQIGVHTGAGTTPSNMYNPPRPPEVYTLPESINDALCDGIRQSFQHDTAGRVLFFSGPPLDRPAKGVSPQYDGLGHSVRYLAGRKAWLADRERKRRRRDMSEESVSKLAAAESFTASGAVNAVTHDATSAMRQWLQGFDDSAVGWQQRVGLNGWECAEEK